MVCVVEIFARRHRLRRHTDTTRLSAAFRAREARVVRRTHLQHPSSTHLIGPTQERCPSGDTSGHSISASMAQQARKRPSDRLNAKTINAVGPIVNLMGISVLCSFIDDLSFPSALFLLAFSFDFSLANRPSRKQRLGPCMQIRPFHARWYMGLFATP